MNKKANTWLFMLAATVFNIVLTFVCFVVSLFLYGKFLSWYDQIKPITATQPAAIQSQVTPPEATTQPAATQRPAQQVTSSQPMPPHGEDNQ